MSSLIVVALLRDGTILMLEPKVVGPRLTVCMSNVLGKVGSFELEIHPAM